MRQLLIDFRDLLNAPADERLRRQTDLPRSALDEHDPAIRVFHQAVRGLSDADIDALLRGESVSLAPERFRATVAAFNQFEQGAYRDFLARLGSGRVPPPPPKPVEVGDDVRLRLGKNTFSGANPSREFEYALHLDGVFDDQWMTLNPLDKPEAAERSDETAGPVIDLAPYLLGKGVTAGQRDSLAHTLRAFAAAAGVNVAEEHFLKVGLLGAPVSGLKRSSMKGTRAQLLKRICDNWGYDRAEKSGTYYLWSKSWVFDKAIDIPEYSVARWRKVLKKRDGQFASDDLIGIAREYTWPQVAITLPLLLTEGVTFSDGAEFPPTCLRWISTRTQYQALRLQGVLSPSERSSALSDAEGMAVRELHPEAVNEVVRFVLVGHEEENPAKRDALRQAALAGRVRLRRAEGYLREPPLVVDVLRGD